MILIYYLVLKFLSVLSPPIPDDDTTPRTVACYQSIQYYHLYFVIELPFPSAPNYLHADTEYHLYPLDPNQKQISDRVTHQLLRVDRKCPSTLPISDDNVKFEKLELRINIYLGYLHSQFLDFRYNFNQDYDYSLTKLTDVHGNAHLHVNMAPGKQFLPDTEKTTKKDVMKLLKRQRVETSHLCVKAEQNQFIITPSFNNVQTIGHISEVTARVFQNGVEDGYVSWPAYGCTATGSYIPLNQIFITSKHDDKTTLLYTLRFVDEDLGPKPLSRDEVATGVHFVTSDIVPEGLDVLENLPSEAEKVFMIDVWKKSETCSKDIEQFAYRYGNNVRLYGYRYEPVDSAIGSLRYEWVYIPGSQAC